MRAFLQLITLPWFFLIAGRFSCFSQDRPVAQQGSAWNIDKVRYTYQSKESGAGLVTKSGTERNAGTFVFVNDSVLSYSYTLDGMKRSGAVKLGPQSSAKVFLSFSGTEDKAVIRRSVYVVLEQEAGNIEMQGSESLINGKSQVTLSATFYLKK